MALFVKAVSLVLGPAANEAEAIVKISLFVLLFALFSKSSARIFTESRFATSLFSFVVSLLMVRLMPLVWIMPMGKILWVLAVLALPYLLVDAIVHEWSLLKIALLAGAYFFIYLLLVALGFWGFGLIFEAVKDVERLVFMYRWQSVIVGGLLVAYVLLMLGKRKKAEAGWRSFKDKDF